jgi:tetratricopeptide (TPR) repeat protein
MRPPERLKRATQLAPFCTPLTVNPPDPAFERTMQAAEGFFQLGMLQDAWNELEELQPTWRHFSQVALLRVHVLNNLERWEEAATIGRGALRDYPQFGPLYLATAHALRHCQDAAAAKAVIMEGESVLKDEAIFYWMLACYDCQMGNLGDARAELRIALELDNSMPLGALENADLVPLWESFGESV